MPMTTFTQESLDLLTTILGDVLARPMFGGYGFYHKDKIFGCVSHDALYLKADDSTRDIFLAAGAMPMTNDGIKQPGTRTRSMPYYTVDTAADHFEEWVRLAAAVAERSSKPPKKARLTAS